MENESASLEMPKYRCHKEVWALKIARIEQVDPAGLWNAGATITPTDGRYAPFFVSGEYCAKHNPQAGGYFVLYEDGYRSWSPAEAFESGYSLLGKGKL